MGKALPPSYIDKRIAANPGPEYNIKSSIGTDSPKRSFGKKLEDKPSTVPGPG
jgi:hypothetical protein